MSDLARAANAVAAAWHDWRLRRIRARRRALMRTAIRLAYAAARHSVAARRHDLAVRNADTEHLNRTDRTAEETPR